MLGDALVPQTGQQPVKSISATGFVAEVKATPMLAKPSHRFAQNIGVPVILQIVGLDLA
jgi:hypothetical protein